ncbi:unnamed protein product [Ectocarpus sp. 12 AP-2014]
MFASIIISLGLPGDVAELRKIVSGEYGEKEHGDYLERAEEDTSSQVLNIWRAAGMTRAPEPRASQGEVAAGGEGRNQRAVGSQGQRRTPVGRWMGPRSDCR